MNQVDCFVNRRCCICGGPVKLGDLPHLVNGFPQDPVVCGDPECNHVAYSGSIYVYAVQKTLDPVTREWLHFISDVDYYNDFEDEK